jgi:hypothetical protein
MWIYYIRRKPPTCFGQLLWPSSGRCCTKDGYRSNETRLCRSRRLYTRTYARDESGKKDHGPYVGYRHVGYEITRVQQMKLWSSCTNHVIAGLVPVLFDCKSITAIDVRFVHSAKCTSYRVPEYGKFIAQIACVRRVISWQVPCWVTQGKGHPMYYALSNLRCFSLVVILLTFNLKKSIPMHNLVGIVVSIVLAFL